MAKSVLIIEDDEDTRTIYREALENRGYEVIVATNGAEGVHLARTARPSLILLDIKMPVMDGWDALLYLRSLQETQKIPICGISAYSPTEEEHARVGNMDFDCFLLKPVDPNDVITEISARIGPPDSPTIESPPAG